MQSSSKSKGGLVQENARLREENIQLAEQLSHAKKQGGAGGRGYSWRTIFVVLLGSFSVALLIVGNVLFWSGNTIAKTDRYVATVSPLVDDPEIQKAVATYANTKIYENVDVNQITEEVLPPRAAFLAAPLEDQLKGYTQKTLEKVVASDRFETFWDNANQRTHQRLVSAATKHQGNGTINLNNVYQYLSQQLQGTKLSFLADKKLPSNVGNVTVIQADWLPAFHKLVTRIDVWRMVAILLLVGTAAGAIWLSRNKRKTIIALGWFYAIGMFITLVSVRIGRETVTSNVASQYQQAVQNAYQIIMHPLVVQTTLLMVIGLLVVFITWLNGTSKSATSLKKRIGELFTGNIHNAIFGTKENSVTAWVGYHKQPLVWGSIGLISSSALFIQLTPAALFYIVLAMIVAVIVIEILAPPSVKRKGG